MENIFDNFGENVFGDSLMREKLQKDVYDSLKNTMEQGCPLNENIANIIAEAMKEWAINKGATHYSHWFQPMTGITAEKHECFLNPSQGGKIITKFRGKELIKGENDASSFPNGGIRATFEARGYTAWDPTSYAFIKDNTLCIPTAFCSYSGEALDKKTPLLRSMQAINKEAMRVLKLFNSSATHVNVTVGAEQEYFLVDKADFIARHDLVYCGRTLFGAMPPKGQELNDHYYGTIPTRVKDFMQDLDNELWKLGVLAKIEHNEVAPSQYELAPCYTTVNISTDQNQLTMELMRKVADRHNLACLLHEKPFANINGSGKHNNWSLSTDTGANLLEAGASPSDNAQFLLFFTAIIKAVDEYQDLLRVAVSSAGNDHRLGEHEAPPAIISVFIGEELLEILEAVEHGTKNSEKNKTYICIGVDTLPQFPKDSTDRNRTSPFAFTGNKFEFRMLGSAFSIADCNTTLNTIVAEELSQFADTLENVSDFPIALNNLIATTYKKHKRIISNGNNYSAEWLSESKRRGLLNIKCTADAIPLLSAPKNIKLFTKHGVLCKREILSRQKIMLENYCNVMRIEALCVISMTIKQIFPAINYYIDTLCQNISNRKKLSINNYKTEKTLLVKLTSQNNKMFETAMELKSLIIECASILDEKELAMYYCQKILPKMNTIRAFADYLEQYVPQKYWPFPTYDRLLFGVN